jgi:hypothetical protein
METNNEERETGEIVLSAKEVKALEKRLRTAHKFVEAMNFDERFRRSISRMMGRAAEQDVEDMLKVGEELCDKYLDAVIAEVITHYATVYDKKTLKGMVKFAKSKAGKSYFDNYDNLEVLLVALSTKWMQAIAFEAMERYDQLILKRQVDNGISYSKFVPPLYV